MKKALCVLMISVAALSLCACNKTAATCEDFLAVVSSAGYQIEEWSGVPEIAEGYIAQNEDETFFVAFCETVEPKFAQNAYGNELESMKERSGSFSIYSYKNLNGCGCAKLKAADTYEVSAYIDNTYMYGAASADRENALKDLFKELGYYF